jgi:hypothetical protein
MRIRRERMRSVAIVRTVMWTEGEMEVGELFFVILVALARSHFLFLACRDAMRNLDKYFNQPCWRGRKPAVPRRVLLQTWRRRVSDVDVEQSRLYL